jgi:four helix bundle protein
LHIGDQLLKAGTSPGANYEEACGAESRSDFIHKLGIVLKELKESRYWLKIIHNAGLLPLDHIKPLLAECEELCAIIARSIFTARAKRDTKGKVI